VTAPPLAPAVRSMTSLVTRPYGRGAEILQLHIGADVAGWTTIDAYGFTNYAARYGALPPAPAYVLYATASGPPDATEVVVEYTDGGPPATVGIPLPAGFLAGASFAIPLPGPSSSLRLTRFRQRPVTVPGTGAAKWTVLALLGNVAKLLWVLGWEKDAIRSTLDDVRRQRRRADARASSLDLLGRDLRVPRFPPAEHSFDASILALYHLNGDVAAGGAVVDDMKQFGAPGHDGVNNGAVSGVPGKFGAAFRFPGSGGSGDITIPHDAAFDIAAGASFTVEAFVKPDGIDDPAPRIIIMKRATEQLAPSSVAGWALSLGTFRGVANNLMCSVADGAVELKLFADVDLADGAFHHVAAVLDRASLRLRLFLDGVEVASGALDTLGAGGTTALTAVANAAPIRIGRGAAANQFAGTIDEVRLSGVARADFNPVLGESDARYRRRLGIFEGWLLPTPGALLSTINTLVQIGGQPDSFIIVEENRPGASVSKVVRIVPATVVGEQSIDGNGTLGVTEEASAGRPADDETFAPTFLLRHDRPPVVTYADENARRMQAATMAVFDDLVDSLVAAVPGQAVIVDEAYDPTSTTLHAVGRALRLRHATLTPDALALAAHRAGFDYVMNRTAAVEVAMAVGDKLAVVIEPRAAAETPPADLDVYMGKGVDLHALPEPLPAGGLYSWTLVPCGPGRAHFERHPLDAATLHTPLAGRRHLRLVADAPGDVTIHVEYAYRAITVSGTLTLRVGVETLATGSTLGANGALRVSEDDAVGKAGEVVNPIYLVTSSLPGVDYGADPNNKRMQVGLERPLNQLVELLAGAGGQLRVLKAFDPAGPRLHPAGRALRLAHTVLGAGDLAAAAFRAGFGFVERTAADVYVSVRRSELIDVVIDPTLAPLPDELTVGTTVRMRPRLDPLPAAGTYNWSTDAIADASGTFSTVTRALTRFTPREPGLISLNVTYIENDLTRALPYTFEVRLKSALDVPGTVIPKYEYDLIMNILNYFHPIGVEVGTSNLREHVVEVKASLLNAFPGYTYPDYRG
jgi:hypothetical protein